MTHRDKITHRGLLIVFLMAFTISLLEPKLIALVFLSAFFIAFLWLQWQREKNVVETLEGLSDSELQIAIDALTPEQRKRLLALIRKHRSVPYVSE